MNRAPEDAPITRSPCCLVCRHFSGVAAADGNVWAEEEEGGRWMPCGCYAGSYLLAAIFSGTSCLARPTYMFITHLSERKERKERRPIVFVVYCVLYCVAVGGVEGRHGIGGRFSITTVCSG